MKARETVSSLMITTAVGAAVLACAVKPEPIPERPALASPTAETFSITALSNATLYHHRYRGVPCYSVRLPGQGWELVQAESDRVLWSKGPRTLSVYFTDNRRARFSPGGGEGDRVLRDYLGYELSYVRPSFAFHSSDPPKFATDANGQWMQWAWQGLGGVAGEGVQAPADQRHVVANLWLEPWMLSFDWATDKLYAMRGPTPAMIDVLDSLEFDPTCNRG